MAAKVEVKEERDAMMAAARAIRKVLRSSVTFSLRC